MYVAGLLQSLLFVYVAVGYVVGVQAFKLHVDFDAEPIYIADLVQSALFFWCNTWQKCQSITTTRLYGFDPLKLRFYKVKLGFSGVYIIFSYFTKTKKTKTKKKQKKNTDYGYSLEPPRRGGSNKYT